jgi:signal transduction histidine kinase
MSVSATWEPAATGRFGMLLPVVGPLIAGAAYYVGGEAAFAIGTLTHQFAPFWPPNVVLLCALLLAPRRRWPLYIAAAFPAHFLVEGGVSMPFAQVGMAFLSNVLVAALSAAFLSRAPPDASWLGSLRNASVYILVAVIAVPAAVALVAGIEPLLSGGNPEEYGRFWWRWYLANALGNLTLTPIFLSWLWDGVRLPLPRPSRRRAIEAIVLAMALTASCAVAFSDELRRVTEAFFPAFLYLPVPLLLAAAARFGGKGASGAILIVTVAVLFRSMHSAVPFDIGAPGQNVLSVQLFLAVVAIPTLLLAALVEELRRSVAERSAAEVGAQSARDLLQSSLDALSAQIVILDDTGRITAANAAWERAAWLVPPSGEFFYSGANYVEISERGRPYQQTIAAGLRRVMTGELKDFRCEYRSEYVVGRHFQLRGTRFGSGPDLHIVVAHEDITEVKASESALRDLTGKLLRSQDEERRRIARELHDSTAQNLLGATLGIGQALRLVPRLRVPAKAALEESRALIDATQRDIRAVAYLLHPPMLDEAGLPAALRWLTEGFAKRAEIRIELDISPEIARLPREIEAALFRIAQEGLSNAHRHSGSATVRIGLRRDPFSHSEPGVALAIEDDGRGLPADVMPSPPAQQRPLGGTVGVGLAGMRERLHQLGGRLDIRSGSAGTTVHAAVPLPPERPLRDNP